MTKYDVKIFLLGILSYFISTTISQLLFGDSLWKWVASLIIVLLLVMFIYFFYAKPRAVEQDKDRDERVIANTNKAGNITLYITLALAVFMVFFLEVNTQHLRILILVSTIVYIGINLYFHYEK